MKSALIHCSSPGRCFAGSVVRAPPLPGHPTGPQRWEPAAGRRGELQPLGGRRCPTQSAAPAGSLQPWDPHVLPRGQDEADWGLRDGGCWRRGVPGGALGAYTGVGGTRTASAAVANRPKRSRRAEPALQGLGFIVKLPRAPVLTERSVGPLGGGTEAWDDPLLIRDPAAQKGLRGGGDRSFSAT